MNINFIKSSEKKKIVEQLNEQFGIENLPYLLLQTGKDKIRGFSGSISKEEINELASLANIEIIGLYILKEEENYRLSFDASQLLSSQIKKNQLEINEAQLKDWLRGIDLEIAAERGTLVIKYQDDFIGCGKSNGEKIFNYVPKNRRLRK